MSLAIAKLYRGLYGPAQKIRIWREKSRKSGFVKVERCHSPSENLVISAAHLHEKSHLNVTQYRHRPMHILRYWHSVVW